MMREMRDTNRNKEVNLHMFTDKMIIYIKALMTPLQHF